MLVYGCFALCLIPVIALEDTKSVFIRKAGFPQERVNKRAACAERLVKRTVLNPDFLFPILLGFREGHCSSIGYSRLEGNRKAAEFPGLQWFPLLHQNVTYQMYSRDPTFLDVADCINDECHDHISALGNDGYKQDVAHCISPAVGPCIPKAWACLGDAKCTAALRCGPQMVRKCGHAAWQLLTNPEERKKVECIWNCNQDVKCILKNCGKNALDCVDGKDAICHSVLACLPEGLAHCAQPAVQCLLGKDKLCEENLQCVAHGAQVCGDPAVNWITNPGIADLLTCANQRCPAPATGNNNSVALPPATETQPAHSAAQLACMGLHCAGKAEALLKDKDIASLNHCIADAVDGCEDIIWNCLGDDSCRSDVHCWANSLAEERSSVLKLLTDPKERKLDEALVKCVTHCKHKSNRLARALCMVGKCGSKAAHCLRDTTCMAVLDGIPKAVETCGNSTLNNNYFKKGAQCFGQFADRCSKAGIELLRDPAIIELARCNTKCTRTPTSQAEVIVV